MLKHVATTRHQDRTLTDGIYVSPAERLAQRTRRLVITSVFVPLAAVAVWLGVRFMRDSTPNFSQDEVHFKYGSIGSEPGGSLLEAIGGMLPPKHVFQVLPRICPEKADGLGYAAFGVITEPGQELPVGISERDRLGFRQVGINCALCHTGSYRDSPGSPRRVVLGMPANRLELQRLLKFVTDCVLDDRFTTDKVVGEIESAGTSLSWFDRLLYRYQLVPRLRLATLELERRVGTLLAPTTEAWGPGRVDTFNPYKAVQFHWRLADLPKSDLTGAANYPSLWNQRPREGLHLHWDGNNTSVDERNLSAALGAGVTPVTADYAAIKRVRDWIWELPPPKYPYPIQAALAARGRQIYAGACGDCHGDHRFRDGILSGSRLGQVTPLSEIGTDPSRLHSYSEAFATIQATLYPGSRHRFRHFAKTGGYANRPLDGIWLRAPYLHNGSVPTLRDLLEAPERRPASFYRGYDVYDRTKVGFVSNVASENGRAHFKFDTSVAGNHNAGHRYGVELPDADKEALVEYLKTL
jgi:mono/diheme cytochrome c family protein